MCVNVMVSKWLQFKIWREREVQRTFLLKVFGLERIERCKALSMLGIGKERLAGYKMMLNFKFAHSNANPA